MLKKLTQIFLCWLALASIIPMQAGLLKKTALGLGSTMGALCLGFCGLDHFIERTGRAFGWPEDKALRPAWYAFVKLHAKKLEELNKKGIFLRNDYSDHFRWYQELREKSRKFREQDPVYYDKWVAFFEKKFREAEERGHRFPYGVKIHLVSDSDSGSLAMGFNRNFLSLATGEFFFMINSRYCGQPDGPTYNGFCASHELGHLHQWQNDLPESLRLWRQGGLREKKFLEKLQANNLSDSDLKRVYEENRELFGAEFYAERFGAANATWSELLFMLTWIYGRCDFDFFPWSWDHFKDTLQIISMKKHREESLKNNAVNTHPHDYMELGILGTECGNRLMAAVSLSAVSSSPDAVSFSYPPPTRTQVEVHVSENFKNYLETKMAPSSLDRPA